MINARQEIVLSINSFKELALNVAKNFLNSSTTSRFQELIHLITEYHQLIIDDNGKESLWLSELKELFIKLREMAGEGPLVKDIINFNLLEFHKEELFKKSEVKLNVNYNQLCEDLASTTFYKIYITDGNTINKNLNKYSIDEFCSKDRYRKGCVLLRRMKSFNFDSGDDTKRLISLVPYIKYSKYLNVYDAFLFKSKSDWEIISLLISYCYNLESVNFYSKFYKRKEGELRNYIDSLEAKYPTIKFITKKYNFKTDHHRKIKSDEFEIILDNSFMNFVFENDNVSGKVLAEKSVNLTFK